MPSPESNKAALLDQLAASELSEEGHEQIRERFSQLIDTVLAWSVEHGHEVHEVQKLGGGFKNPVLMVTTASGEQFVAKGFSEREALETTTRAQEIFDDLEASDMPQLIPEAEIYDDTLFSERAEGVPIKSLLESIDSNPESLQRAREAFWAAGATIASIHERTEEPIIAGDERSEELAEQALIDHEKLVRHISEMDVAGMIGESDAAIDDVIATIEDNTYPNFSSLIHADAHLDQFFHEQGGAVVEIVDYDDIRLGDPMADLGRFVSSLRDWSRRLDVGEEAELDLTRIFVGGYESVRKESGLQPNDDELDMMRVVCYELRLHLIKLKQFKALRQQIIGVGQELHLSEQELVFADAETSRIIEQYLSSEQNAEMTELRLVAGEIRSIITYLRPTSDEAEQPMPDEGVLAA